MDELILVKSESFGQVKCDFWQDINSEIFMTREQIGYALEYNQPRTAITKIHERHNERLNKFSVVTKLVSTDTKAYEKYLYSTKGVYEICRWSRQPKADAFMDWVWEIIDVIRKGDLTIIQKSKSRELEAEAKLINARTRQVKTLFDAVKGLKAVVSKDIIEKITGVATEVLTGKPLERPLNIVERELKLRDLIDYKFNMMEQEDGKMSKALVKVLLKDYRREYEVGKMLPEVYRALSAELHRRLN